MECGFCGESKMGNQVCGQCEKVSYCSQDCAELDWEEHKLKCSSHLDLKSNILPKTKTNTQISLSFSAGLFPGRRRRRYTPFFYPYYFPFIWPRRMRGRRVSIRRGRGGGRGGRRRRRNGELKLKVNETTGEVSYETRWISEGFESPIQLGYKSGHFGKRNPHEALAELIEMFWIPSMFDPEMGGRAIWDRKLLRDAILSKDSQVMTALENVSSVNKEAMRVLVEIEIKDEQIPHFPFPNRTSDMDHVDFLYASSPIMVSKDKRQDVLNITDSVWKIGLNHWVVVRCHFMGANWSTLLSVVRVLKARTRFAVRKAQGEYLDLIRAIIKKPEIWINYVREINDYIDKNPVQIRGVDYKV